MTTKSKGLIFSARSIDAMLHKVNPKNQTRRLCGLQAVNADAEKWEVQRVYDMGEAAMFVHYRDKQGWHDHLEAKCPWNIGEQVYAKETWRTGRGLDDFPPRMSGPKSPFQYKADMATIRGKDVTKWSPWGKWRSPLHMPRWAARPELIRPITGIWCERVQEISFRDIVGEGYDDYGIEPIEQLSEFPRGITWFRNRWNSLHAAPKTIKGGSKWAEALGWNKDFVLVKFYGANSRAIQVLQRIEGKKIVGYVSFPFSAADGDKRKMIRGKKHFRCVNPWVFVLEFRERNSK